MSDFATPYTANKILFGVRKTLNSLSPKRPLWLQSFYPATPNIVNSKTINVDEEYGLANVMGTFASPRADVNPIALPNFGHAELSFSYAKEAVTDADEDEDTLDIRQFGQQFSNTNDLMANYAARMNRKFALVEQRFENLQEFVAAQIMLYAGYGAVSEYHPLYVYDFQREKVTLAVDLVGTAQKDMITSVNLTTTAVTAPWDSTTTILPVVATDNSVHYDKTDGTDTTYVAGAKAWTSTNLAAGTATPYLDVVKMVESCEAYSTAEALHMSDDAYKVFNEDIETNYKAAAETTTLVLLKIDRDIMPSVKTLEGLQFQRTVNLGTGKVLPIYTYKAVYHDRVTGVKTRYIGQGWVNIIPSEGFFRANGRIKHKKARFAAMERWMNKWSDEKSGTTDYEWHTNFIMGNLNINGLVSWKVK